MKPFRIYPSEKTTFKDRVSGVTIHRLTEHLGHSIHPYFTNNGWYDDNQKMLFTSHRGNVSNIHSIDIASGEISQLTDMPGYGQKASFSNHVNSVRNETYYWHNRCAYALDLRTLETRPLWVAPKGFNTGSLISSADGNYVFTYLNEDISDRVYTNLSAGYIGMRELFQARPKSKIVRISVDGGGAEIVWEEDCWANHVNPSCTQSNILTFAHEGPWDLVDHRMWVLDVSTGKVSKLRERRVEGEKIGHEYWHLDGIHVGYQVHRPEVGSFFGFVKYDGTGEMEAPAVRYSGPDHVHSNDFNMVVSDSGKTIKVYRYNGAGFDGPRILCMHDGSFHLGFAHPHPRITADGKSVVYNSDATGYCNIYMAEFPEDFYSLPELEIPSK